MAYFLAPQQNLWANPDLGGAKAATCCTPISPSDSTELRRTYIQITQVEEAFRNLKGDLAIRPIHHQSESRIEAHIFIAFLAYCLHVTLAQQLRAHAPGLTPRSVLEKFAAVQMIDVEIPITDA